MGWDVYGSSVPINWVLSLVGSPVQQGRPPRLGRDIFRYFPTKEHFDQDLAACQRAMRLAQDLHSPALIEETRVICGLVKILKGLYLMAEAVVPGKKMTASERNVRPRRLPWLIEQARKSMRGWWPGALPWPRNLCPRALLPALAVCRYDRLPGACPQRSG